MPVCVILTTAGPKTAFPFEITIPAEKRLLGDLILWMHFFGTRGRGRLLLVIHAARLHRQPVCPVLIFGGLAATRGKKSASCI